eukprot:238844-Amorphochlora_amoeboformis.AAC.1
MCIHQASTPFIALAIINTYLYAVDRFSVTGSLVTTSIWIAASTAFGLILMGYAGIACIYARRITRSLAVKASERNHRVEFGVLALEYLMTMFDLMDLTCRDICVVIPFQSTVSITSRRTVTTNSGDLDCHASVN